MTESPQLFLPAGYQRRGAEHYFSDIPNTDQWQAEVYHLGQLFRPATVLDVGCGSGFKLRQNFPLAKRMGLDVPQTVKWLKKQYPRDAWQVADFTKPLAEKYHLIILADILEHLLDPWACLAWAVDQLAGNGVILLSTPARELLPAPKHPALGPPRNGSHVQEWSSQEFTKFCAQTMTVRFTGITYPHTTVVVGRIYGL